MEEERKTAKKNRVPILGNFLVSLAVNGRTVKFFSPRHTGGDIRFQRLVRFDLRKTDVFINSVPVRRGQNANNIPLKRPGLTR